MAEQAVDCHFAGRPVRHSAVPELVLAYQCSEPLMTVGAGVYLEVEADPGLERLPQQVVSTLSEVCQIETCLEVQADSACRPAVEPLLPPPPGLELGIALALAGVAHCLSCPAALAVRPVLVAAVPVESVAA